MEAAHARVRNVSVLAIIVMDESNLFDLYLMLLTRGEPSQPPIRTLTTKILTSPRVITTFLASLKPLLCR